MYFNQRFLIIYCARLSSHVHAIYIGYSPNYLVRHDVMNDGYKA